MRVGKKGKMKNILMHSPKEKPSTSPDVSTAVQMDISVKIVLDHQPNAMNAIGPEEITRRTSSKSKKIRANKEDTPKDKGKGKAT